MALVIDAVIMKVVWENCERKGVVGERGEMLMSPMHMMMIVVVADNVQDLKENAIRESLNT